MDACGYCLLCLLLCQLKFLNPNAFWELDERVAEEYKAEGAVDSQYVSLTRLSMTQL